MTLGGLWGPVYCPFRRLTGLPCPLCGTTTAALLTLQARPLDALRVNPTGLVAVVLVVALVARAVLARATSRVGARPALALPRAWPGRVALVAWFAASWLIRLHAPSRLVQG